MQLLICTLTWRVNNFVSRQGKGENRRNEGKIIFFLFISINVVIIIIFNIAFFIIVFVVAIDTFVTQLTLADWNLFSVERKDTFFHFPHFFKIGNVRKQAKVGSYIKRNVFSH